MGRLRTGLPGAFARLLLPALGIGAQSVRFQYDARGRQIEKAYFGLNQQPVVIPSGGYAIKRLQRDERGNVLAKRAIEKGVAFVPGTPFFCANPDHATFRLSFATADVDKIREGVARLGQAI